jgi:hypothetical protein
MVNYASFLQQSYSQYVEFLLSKYGPGLDDYYSKKSYDRFLSGEIKTLSKKGKVSRTAEGLYCHHIDEDKQILISTPAAILKFNIPYSYQTKDRLVYCNLIEHAILHIHIAIEQKNNHSNHMALGIGGYVNFIRPELIDWLSYGNVPSSDNNRTLWRYYCYEAVKMPKSDFDDLLFSMDDYLLHNYPITQDRLDEANVLYQGQKRGH